MVRPFGPQVHLTCGATILCPPFARRRYLPYLLQELNVHIIRMLYGIDFYVHRLVYSQTCVFDEPFPSPYSSLLLVDSDLWLACY